MVDILKLGPPTVADLPPLARELKPGDLIEHVLGWILQIIPVEDPMLDTNKYFQAKIILMPSLGQQLHDANFIPGYTSWIEKYSLNEYRKLTHLETLLYVRSTTVA